MQTFASSYDIYPWQFIVYSLPGIHTFPFSSPQDRRDISFTFAKMSSQFFVLISCIFLSGHRSSKCVTRMQAHSSHSSHLCDVIVTPSCIPVYHTQMRVCRKYSETTWPQYGRNRIYATSFLQAICHCMSVWKLLTLDATEKEYRVRKMLSLCISCASRIMLTMINLVSFTLTASERYSLSYLLTNYSDL